MKTSQRAALSAAVIAICAFTSSPCLAQGNSGNNSLIPMSPLGSLSAYPTVVQTGTKPTLTWNILYPSKVSNLATITPPGTITITQPNTTVSVLPIGTSITACDPSQGTTPLPAEARLSLNGSSYQQLFYGTQNNVNPAWVLYSKKLKINDSIDFGGRYVRNNTWSPFYTTLSANMQVVALVKGDTPPTFLPLHTSSRLAAYLAPYLDGSGKVNIGSLSVLILMELGQTDLNSPCFDYQDMVWMSPTPETAVAVRTAGSIPPAVWTMSDNDPSSCKIMKTITSIVALLALLSAEGRSENARPQMRDAATHEQLALKLRQAAQQSPTAKFKPRTGEDPSKVNRPESLLANSDILCFGGVAVLVPKRAILQSPSKLADRLKLQPGVNFSSWADFYAANRGWITTVEVTRTQAEGKEPVPMMAEDHIKKSSNLIVAVYLGGPISVLPPAAPPTTPATASTEITSNTKKP
jgi:hypothetical protein